MLQQGRGVVLDDLRTRALSKDNMRIRPCRICALRQDAVHVVLDALDLGLTDHLLALEALDVL